jgi:oligoribonuclease NrnB/cAMP/cGMP phosphodiesterase (DHH superfamily)
METPTQEDTQERIIVFYHGNCPDGFGGAFSAWKKLGNSAEYFPVSYGKPVPADPTDARVYFIDCCYTQAVMDEIVSKAKMVTVLDHHIGTQKIVESMPEFVFDNNRSGATIAWGYFHPEISPSLSASTASVPKLLYYVEDDDLFRYKDPDTRAVVSYLAVQPFTFEYWDEVMRELEEPVSREAFISKIRTFGEYFEMLADYATRNVKFVEFEGYTVAFATAHPFSPMTSLVGNILANKKYPPFSLIVTAHPEGYGVSIRGDGSIDVSEIARKYGGNGHRNAAGFAVSVHDQMPWKLVEKTDKNSEGNKEEKAYEASGN